jgi:hypothetical protein
MSWHRVPLLTNKWGLARRACPGVIFTAPPAPAFLSSPPTPAPPQRAAARLQTSARNDLAPRPAAPGSTP